MIRSSQNVMVDLLSYGVEFQRNEQGEFLYTKEGAHSNKRILFHEDMTGREITSKLLEEVRRQKNITIYEYTTMTDLIVEENCCKGIMMEYAVTVGGGNNHRYNLSDGVLLKDNHIGAAGSVTKAIEMAKAYAPFVCKIEVEVETLEMVKEAVDAGADIIMLDNMTHEQMEEAIRIIDGKAEVEVSGNVTKENISKLIDLGVDYISSGALTHSAPIIDISLKNLHEI